MLEDVGNEEPQFERATRAARFGASVIDTVLTFTAAATGEIIHPVAIVVALIGLGLVNAWTLHRRRASLGKLAMKLRIVRSDGGEVELWRIVVLRWLPVATITAVPWLNLLTVVDALFIFRADRCCIHDLLAGTAVVDA